MSRDPDRLTDKHLRTLFLEGHITSEQAAQIWADAKWCDLYERDSRRKAWTIALLLLADAILTGLLLGRLN